MGRIEKTVFISYRRANAPWALAISQYLTTRGYDVFIDFLTINSGDFEQIITENIKARAHFLVLLAPSALERCNDPKDWLRREIEIAFESRRNIVPILLENFDFGAPENVKCLTGELENLRNYNGLNIYAAYFVESMQKLCDRFLNVSLDSVLHPVSRGVQSIVKEQKQAVAEEAPVDSDTLAAQEWFERAYKAEEPEEQIRLYTKAIELDSDFAFAYNNRGNSYANLKQYKRAIEDYDQAIKLNPELAGALNNRGASYDKLKQYERAIEDHDQAIKLKPEDAVIYINRGVSYANLKQYERAIEDYDQAIELNPEEGNGYYNKACSYAMQGLVIETTELLRQALTKDAKYFCELVRQDSDFDGISREAVFQKLLEEFCDGC